MSKRGSQYFTVASIWQEQDQWNKPLSSASEERSGFLCKWVSPALKLFYKTWRSLKVWWDCLPDMTFHAVFTAQYYFFHFFWFGGTAQLWMVGCARWRILWEATEPNHSLGKHEQPSLQLERRQGWVWSQRWGCQERGVLLTSLQSSCLSQSCNFSGVCLKTVCLSYITHEFET